jgi:hypothetical protein
MHTYSLVSMQKHPLTKMAVRFFEPDSYRDTQAAFLRSFCTQSFRKWKLAQIDLRFVSCCVLNACSCFVYSGRLNVSHNMSDLCEYPV